MKKPENSPMELLFEELANTRREEITLAAEFGRSLDKQIAMRNQQGCAVIAGEIKERSDG